MFLETLHNLEQSNEFFEWMWRLDSCPEDKSSTQDVVENIREKGLDGYCEDVALFFWWSFEDVRMIQTQCHFCVEYEGKYYDSFNRDGVKEIADLEYFKRNPADDPTPSDYTKYGLKQLPAYYYRAARDLLPFAYRYCSTPIRLGDFLRTLEPCVLVQIWSEHHMRTDINRVHYFLKNDNGAGVSLLWEIVSVEYNTKCADNYHHFDIHVDTESEL